MIVSGGVSVGPYDVVRAAFEEIGRIELWRVAVQPGKPFAFGVVERRRRRPRRSCSGCPGNPVSSFVTFELFVRPAIRRLSGLPADRLVRSIDRAVLRDDVSKSPGRRAFLRVVTERDASGATVRDAERPGPGPAGRRWARAGQPRPVRPGGCRRPRDRPGDGSTAWPAGSPVDLWWLDRD